MLRYCLISIRQIKLHQYSFSKISLPIQQNTIKQIKLHEDILSLEEIYQQIGKVVITQDSKFIDSIRSGKPDAILWQQLKRKGGLKILSNNTAIQILKLINQNVNFEQYDETQIQKKEIMQSNQNQQIVDDVNESLIILFKSRLSQLTLSQISNILKIYAEANRFNQSFFREIENEIYERLQSNEYLNINDAEKILKSYQYCNYGSALLYGKLASTFKIAQFEIDPIKLSEYCRIFTKSRENIKGAFGLIQITEQRIQDRIQDYNFHQLVNIAYQFYSVNIGSNQFQIMLEQKIVEQFPKNELLQISDLIKLAKATSKYLFKFDSLALYNKIESACLELMSHLTNKQFSHIIWSFLRQQRGNLDIYISAEMELNKRINSMKMRQLSILYNCSSGFQDAQDFNNQILNEIKSRIQNIPDDGPILQTLQIQLIQTLIGIIKSDKEQQLQKQIIQWITVTKKINLSSNMEILLSQASINSTLNQHTLNLIQFILSKKNQSQEQLLNSVFIKSILFRYFSVEQKIQLNNQELKKQIFYQAFHLNPRDDHSISMLIFLCDQHGSQMRFVFKQDHWVVISWNILSELIIYKKNIDKRLIDQVCNGIKEVNPNVLSTLNLMKYIQSLIMVSNYEKKELNYPINKICRINRKRQEQLLQNYVHIQNTMLMNDDLLTSISNTLNNVIKSQLLLEESGQFQSYINLYEQTYLLFIPIALLVNVNNDQIKFCLIPVSLQYDFETQLNLSKDDLNHFYQKKYQLNREQEVQVYILKQIGWNTELVIKEIWENQNQQEQEELIKKLFTLQIQDDQDDLNLQQEQLENEQLVDSQLKLNSRRRNKSQQIFGKKLNDKQRFQYKTKYEDEYEQFDLNDEEES